MISTPYTPFKGPSLCLTYSVVTWYVGSPPSFLFLKNLLFLLSPGRDDFLPPVCFLPRTLIMRRLNFNLLWENVHYPSKITYILKKKLEQGSSYLLVQLPTIDRAEPGQTPKAWISIPRRPGGWQEPNYCSPRCYSLPGATLGVRARVEHPVGPNMAFRGPYWHLNRWVKCLPISSLPFLK